MVIFRSRCMIVRATSVPRLETVTDAIRHLVMQAAYERPKPFDSIMVRSDQSWWMYIVTNGCLAFVMNDADQNFEVVSDTDETKPWVLDKDVFNKDKATATVSNWKMGTYCRNTTSRERKHCTGYYASRTVCRSS